MMNEKIIVPRLGEESLFNDFVKKKIDEFIEPERKGTPRGEKIGFPYQKYVACISVALLNSTKKKIAETIGESVGFSYGLLRKWATEEEFKLRVEDFRKEFARYIFIWMRAKNEKYLKDHDNYVNGVTDEEPEHTDFSRIIDISRAIHTEVFENAWWIADYFYYSLAQKHGWDDLKVQFAQVLYLDVIRLKKHASGERIEWDLSTQAINLLNSVMELFEPGVKITEQKRREARLSLKVLKKHLELMKEK